MQEFPVLVAFLAWCLTEVTALRVSAPRKEKGVSFYKWPISIESEVCERPVTVNVMRWIAQNPERDGSEPVKLALTGGPGGGKSSVLPTLSSAAYGRKPTGVDVWVVPEIATVLINGGAVMPPPDGLKWQRSIIRAQAYIEDMVIRAAKRTGRKSLIIFDRGMLDGKAYCSEEEWQTLLSAVQMTEAGMLGRYDAVVHMVTAAKGAASHYKSGQVQDDYGMQTFRRESAQDAIDLDSRQLVAWKRHSNRLIADNGPHGMEGKKELVTAFMLHQLSA